MKLEINEISITKEIINYQTLDDNNIAIRFYQIDLEKMIRHDLEHFFSIIQKYYDVDDETKPAFMLTFQTYLFLSNQLKLETDKTFSAKANNDISRKRIRHFNLSTLYFNEIFNPQEVQRKKPSKETILKESEKIKRYFFTEYGLETFNNLYDKVEFQRILNNALFLERSEIMFYPGDQVYFDFLNEFNLKIEDFFVWLIKDKNSLTNEVIQLKRSQILFNPVYSLIKSKELDLILDEINHFLLLTNNENLLIEGYLSIDRLVEMHPDAFGSIDAMLTQLLNYLFKKKNDSRSKENISWLNNQIDLISNVIASDPETKIDNLPNILFNLIDKRDYYQKIFLECEMLVSNYFRIITKSIYHKLCISEKLTIHEKRLFIATHIGIPSLDHKTPLTEPFFIDYLKHSNYAFNFFMEFVILRSEEFKEYSLINKMYFLSFCKFYAFWHAAVLEVERTDKANKSFSEKTVRLVDENFIQSEKSDDSEDLKELEDIDLEEELGINHEIDVRPSKQKDLVKMRDMIYPEFEFEIYEVLSSILSETQLDIVIKHVFQKMSLTDIANEWNLNPQSVSKTFNRAKRILAKDPKLLDMFNIKRII